MNTKILHSGVNRRAGYATDRDGIGGTVQRLTARASLQRPNSDQILDVSLMLTFCKTNIPCIPSFVIFQRKK